MSEMSIRRWLASTMPSAVVATKPESSRMRSAPTSAPATTASVIGTACRGACCWVSRSSSHSTPAATAATASPTPMLASISPGCQRPLLAELTAWKTSTPSSAPIGSTSTPSHVSSDRTRRAGRMNASSGSTTVGPDTTRIAPRRIATRASRPPNNTLAAPATAAHVTSTPTTTRRITSGCCSGATPANDSRSPASKRMIPTAIDTNGW